jgi:hypothetical protein
MSSGTVAETESEDSLGSPADAHTLFIFQFRTRSQGRKSRQDGKRFPSHLTSHLLRSSLFTSKFPSIALSDIKSKGENSKLQEVCDLFFQSKRKTRKTDREGDVSKTPSRILLFLSLSLLPPSNPPDSERILVP